MILGVTSLKLDASGDRCLMTLELICDPDVFHGRGMMETCARIVIGLNAALDSAASPTQEQIAEVIASGRRIIL